MFGDVQDYVAMRESFAGWFHGVRSVTHSHFTAASTRLQRLMQVCTAGAPSLLGMVSGEGDGMCYNAKGCCGGGGGPGTSVRQLPTTEAQSWAMIAEDNETHETRNV